MANPERGEVALTVGDRVYTWVLDFNALCELEELVSKPGEPMTWAQVFALAMKEGAIYQRALVWAALRRHHGEMSLRDAGQFLEDAGGFEALSKTLSKLRKVTLPEGESRPRKARPSRTAGARTTSTRDASD